MARLKLKFPSLDALRAATSMETTGSDIKVVNEKRLSLAIESLEKVPSAPESFALERDVNLISREFGATVVQDVQYDLEDGPRILVDAPESTDWGTLQDVLAAIGADAAHGKVTGEGVTLAIVDTGVDGSHPEFPAARRAGGWAPAGEDAWTDWEGHGTMCMTIAAASTAAPRQFVGVAPGARLFACRTHFYDSELGAIYDLLSSRSKGGEKIVASNSFGRQTGTAPTPDENSDFLPALSEAIGAGVFVVCSAGNYHDLAGGLASACDPTSVWLHKCRDDLLTVATCDLERQMWYYSSRGPGQHYGEPGTNQKPDVTAPTPRNGRILYGPGERVLQNGWGTSGACPQVAGLAALIWSAKPDMPASDLARLIRSTCADLGYGYNCQGHGMIDCGAAVSSALVG